MKISIIRKIFLLFWIVVERNNKDEFQRKITEYKFNPYNPLAYIVILILLLIIFILFGVGGLTEVVDNKEISFKWKRL